MLLKYSSTGLFTELLALCDMFESSAVVVDRCSSRVYEVFPRQVAAGAISRVSLLRQDGFWHVLLPSRATDVELPALMAVPPAAWQAVAERMVYRRAVAMGVVGSVDMMDEDVLPPVCLAMPPRPLQGQELTADPEPWGVSRTRGCSALVPAAMRAAVTLV